MRNQIIFAATLSCLILGTQTSFATTPESPLQVSESIWKRFSSTDGRFAVLFPGEPRKVQQTIKYAATNSTEMYMFFVERTQENAVYAVAYNDYPNMSRNASPEQAKTLLTIGRNAVIDSLGATLISEQDISLGRYPGRELRFKHPKGLLGKIRLYLVNGRLYQVWTMVGTGKEKYLTRSIEGFLNSFQLITE